jgi:hypothetical protein
MRSLESQVRQLRTLVDRQPVSCTLTIDRGERSKEGGVSRTGEAGGELVACHSRQTMRGSWKEPRSEVTGESALLFWLI